MRRGLFHGITLAFFLHAAPLACQQRAQAWHEEVWNGIGAMLLPDIVRDVRALRDSIRVFSSTPAESREEEIRRTDRLYLTSVGIAEGDPLRALLLAAMASLPYRTFPARIPLLGLVIHIPVSSETRAEFAARCDRLPTRLFADTPAWGDRDKLPHFFGSAWLQAALRSRGLTLAVGDCIEIGEALFKLEGAVDIRDDAANRLGARFGAMLAVDENMLPSAVLCSQDSLR